MSEIKPDKSGYINYGLLISNSAGIMSSLMDVEQQRAMAETKVQQQEEYGDLVMGMLQEEMTGALDNAMRNLDREGSGLLTIEQLADAVYTVLPDITENQMGAVMALGLPDDDGNVWYDDVSEWAWPTLEYLPRHGR